MQNNQQPYSYRSGNNEAYAPNNYWNNQQRFNNINDYNNQRYSSSLQYPHANGYYSQQHNSANYSTGFTNGYNSFHPIGCCGSKGFSTNNQPNQFNQYERNAELNSYNYPPSSSTNRATNFHMNGLYNTPQTSNNQYRQQLKTLNGTGDLSSNFFQAYPRKYC